MMSLLDRVKVRYMKESYSHLNKLQKEALINEYKGNLFEYLVANMAARILGFEADFLLGFKGEEKQRLQTYESWLRAEDQSCFRALPSLAQQAAVTLCRELENNSSSFKNILVIGKKWGNKAHSSWDEADLLLVTDDLKTQGLSLKLCRGHSYVNTKSAGARSFIEKYFHPFEQSAQLQQKINLQIDHSFIQMGQELYQRANLGDFSGRFDDRWSDSHLPELPGELSPEYRPVVQASYAEVIHQIYEAMVYLQQTDRKRFSLCLRSLLGFGNSHIWQLMCFYKGEYEFSHCEFETNVETFFKDDLVTIHPLKKELGSFEIQIGEIALQIRVKPMNKFTASAHKINCSLKRLKKVEMQ